MILTVLLTAALTVAACIIVALARTNLAMDAHLTAQRHRFALDAEAIDIRDRQIGHLSTAIEQQHERINWYIEENGRLEDRNQCLERVQRRNLYKAVVVTPVMDGPRILERAQQINLN